MLKLSLAAAQEAAAEMCVRLKAPVLIVDVPDTCYFTVVREGAPVPEGSTYKQLMRPGVPH